MCLFWKTIYTEGSVCKIILGIQLIYMKNFSSYLPQKNTSKRGRAVRFILACVVLASLYFALDYTVRIMLFLLAFLGFFEAYTGWTVINSLEEKDTSEKSVRDNNDGE